MRNLNKKGLSEIVQIVMISALSVLAIITVSKYVLSLSNDLDNQLSPAVDCLTMKSRVLSACINSNNQIEMNVNLFDTEDPILKISSGSELFSCNSQTCSACQLTEGTKTIYINPQVQETEISYQFDSCTPQSIVLTACAEP